MSNWEPINLLGATALSEVELCLPPAEVLRRVREAVPGVSCWEKFQAEVGRESFEVWQHRQLPRLRARVEPRGTGSVLHYEVVVQPAWLALPALFVAVLLGAPAILGTTSEDSTLLCCLYPLVVPMAILFISLPIVFSRITSRALLDWLQRTFEDMHVLGGKSRETVSGPDSVNG